MERPCRNFTSQTINISQPGPNVYIEVTDGDTAGEIVGTYGYTDGDGDSCFPGFEQTGSVFSTFNPPASSNILSIGITESGEIFRTCIDNRNVKHGFIYSNRTFTNIDGFLASSTSIDGVSDSGIIYGSYGFIDNAGSVTIINPPGSIGTSVAVTGGGEVVGNYMDSVENTHGFAFENGQYATIDVSGATSTYVSGFNDSDEIVGHYSDAFGSIPDGRQRRERYGDAQQQH
ncbi:MAG: hypothetical protein WA268_29100 [Xanthobacteraceae bacterium]